MFRVTFEEIYKNSFSKVYKYFYYKYVDKSYIEDLSQETFLRFYKEYSQQKYSKEESMKILYGIARNIYKEWVRKAISETNIQFFDNINYEELAEIDDDYDYTETDEFLTHIDLVKNLIEELNEKTKMVLKYRFLDGKSRKEIAAILSISEKDVHTYQKRGIKYLKKKIGESVPPQS